MDLDSQVVCVRDRFKSDKSVDGTYDWTIDPKRIIYPIPNSFAEKLNELQIRAQRSGMDRRRTGDSEASHMVFLRAVDTG